ncbi:Gas vesicle synthesis protein GvpL/GvpF [Desulfocicer vacuolatum DSM 3385]|uniref:Gas vesicle synthesis protein GvpL/GvpF n=1 Tax=Desulfocicer vacuolatum DSM 3385 TaxID=1121400 RepID=A0A1W2BE46_9BACT|nr:GvpL/GvpF family gas vesicle protein [Desulfocicer vacuolatum]SMC71081.1 Gas vesicle synthesis protein GvpL/GvpF [Desulfocicer vacuolatum DSM 3385]
MTLHLLYCVFSSGEMEKTRKLVPPGIDGEPVHEICSNKISGVVSTLGKPPDTHVKSLLAYHGVIDSYHQNRTVIPMRFAAVFRTYAHMITALNNNEKSYLLQLKRLHDCTEMCVRFISNSPCCVKKKEPAISPKKISGTTFLQQRKAMYEQQNRLPPEIHEKTRDILQHFRGLYMEFKQESQPLEKDCPSLSLQGAEKTDGNALLISLFFLISKKNISLFRSRFQNICGSSSGRHMMNGPWPPFNFINTESNLTDPS